MVDMTCLMLHCHVKALNFILISTCANINIFTIQSKIEYELLENPLLFYWIMNQNRLSSTLLDSMSSLQHII